MALKDKILVLISPSSGAVSPCTKIKHLNISGFNCAINIFKTLSLQQESWILNSSQTLSQTWKIPYWKTLCVICALNHTQNRNLSPACTLSAVSAFSLIYNPDNLQLLQHLPFFIMTASHVLSANRGLSLNGSNVSVLEALVLLLIRFPTTFTWSVWCSSLTLSHWPNIVVCVLMMTSKLGVSFGAKSVTRHCARAVPIHTVHYAWRHCISCACLAVWEVWWWVALVIPARSTKMNHWSLSVWTVKCASATSAIWLSTKTAQMSCF